jgi:predicted AAA+ superfamily ATPase
MLAHYHGQAWNAAAPARALDVSASTTRRYLDLLTDAFMIRQLQPYYANIAKRQVKAPKIYLRDSGLLHQLLAIRTEGELMNHPSLGASWEGFVIEQLLAWLQPEEAFFWSTHQGAEIDLVLRQNGRWLGVECKRTDAPRLTRSIRIALDDLKLEQIIVVYPGQKSYALDAQVNVVPLRLLGSEQDAVAQFCRDLGYEACEAK